MGSWEYEMGFKDGKKGQDATITSLREEIDGLKAEVAAFERARGELISNTIKENAALKLRDESLEARLEFRGKVTKGVFCDGCSSWEQMAWEAEEKLEKVREFREKWRNCRDDKLAERDCASWELIKAIIGEVKP